MKKIIIAAFCMGIFALSNSCKKEKDFLDKAPGVDVTIDTIFSSSTQVETFVAGMYQQGIYAIINNNATPGIYNGLVAGNCDEGETVPGWFMPNNWNSAVVSVDRNGDDRWQYRWVAIRMANIILQNIDGVPNATPEFKNRVKGEALFVRALNYFDMLRRYAGVPILDKPVDVGAETKIGRSSLADVVSFIAKDCDDASALLPSVYPATMKGRASKGAALLLKSRTLLYAASPMFNTATPYLSLGANNNLICYGDYDKSRWQLAADAAKAVLDWAPSANCHLITDKGVDRNYEYACYQVNNDEMILANNFIKSTDWNLISPVGIYGYWAGLSPTFNFVKFYEKKDGTPQIWNPNGGNDLTTKMAQLDNRFAQTIAYNNYYWNSDYPSIQIWQGGDQSNSCYGGFWLHKFTPQGSKPQDNIPANLIVFRFAEAYLNYAEALNEAQGPVQEAYNAVNAIRKRSGMPDLPAGLSQDQFRDRVRNERAVELAYEEQRFFDIMRWQIAENDGVMKGNMYGIKVYKIDGSTEFKYVPYVFEVRSFNKNMYLHPFLRTEINKDYLVQNPGW